MSKILFISLFLALAAYGQTERIAIMHTVDDGDSVNVMDLGYLTDKLRDIGGQVLPPNRYGIMTQQSIVDRLGSQERAEKECREATCIADLGRKINADYIAQGRIGRFSGKLTMKVELYKVSNSHLIGSFTGDSDDLRGLLVLLEAKAPKLFDAMTRISSTAPLPPQPPPPPPPVVPPVAEKKDCVNKFNINELVLKIENGFPTQLKDCSATLAKNMALAASPFGKKTEQKEPKAFMMECAIDGIKHKLPLGSEEYVKPVEGFVQNLLDASSAGGSFDVKKFSGTIGGMDMGGLLGGIRKLATEDDCVVDEPYEPPVAAGGEEGGAEGKEDKKKVFSWGLRVGGNLLWLKNDYTNASGYYGSGSQFGLVFDWALTDWLHIQSGIMRVEKYNLGPYVEIPLLLSLKFSALRINAGPYFGTCYRQDCKGSDGRVGDDLRSGDGRRGDDFGISTGFGFDIGNFFIFGFKYGFYIGAFYDYGLTESYNDSSLKAYNRTLGFDLGVNFL